MKHRLIDFSSRVTGPSPPSPKLLRSRSALLPVPSAQLNRINQHEASAPKSLKRKRKRAASSESVGLEPQRPARHRRILPSKLHTLGMPAKADKSREPTETMSKMWLRGREPTSELGQQGSASTRSGARSAGKVPLGSHVRPTQRQTLNVRSPNQGLP